VCMKQGKMTKSNTHKSKLQVKMWFLKLQETLAILGYGCECEFICNKAATLKGVIQDNHSYWNLELLLNNFLKLSSTTHKPLT
jgi:hypothetical protein